MSSSIPTSTADDLVAGVATVPLVSIVVPVLNGVGHLRESLDSILAQTHPRLEVIVLDDGSTDGSLELLAEYEERGVRVVRNGETLGIYANANRGIELAEGELVGVFHADDVYEPELVARQVEYLRRHPNVGVLFASDVFIDADGVEFGRLELPEEVRGARPLDYEAVVNALLTYKNCFLRCPSALVRTSVHRDVGVYDQERFKNTADVEMWLRIARSYRVAVLDDHLFRYRRGHGSSSERYHGLRTDEERFFAIMDRELARGADGIVRRSARRAYEAHRTEDILMRAASHYILGSSAEGLALLRTARPGRLLASNRVQRFRLAALWLALHALLRLPRSGTVAKIFHARWHGGSARRSFARKAGIA